MLAISKRLDLPPEILTGDPIAELKGRGELCVQCHRGITAYSGSCICIATRTGALRVSGEGLQVLRMDRERIVVRGRIDALRYGEGDA